MEDGASVRKLHTHITTTTPFLAAFSVKLFVKTPVLVAVAGFLSMISEVRLLWFGSQCFPFIPTPGCRAMAEFLFTRS